MDKYGTVLAANETYAKRLGVNMDKLIGAIIYDLLSPDLAKLRKKQTENVISTGKPVRFEDIRNNRNIDQVIYPILDTRGQVVRMAVFGVDITQRRKIEKQLETMALTDQLTGLYNRRGFVTIVERQLQQAKRSRHKMLLFFADIDGMKWINDKFGHKEGDKALINTAKILVQTFRMSDIISRIGGDEFAILAVDIENTVLDSLQNRFNKFLDCFNCRKRQKYCLSVSIGFATYDPYNPSSLDKLMFNADRSMYENKKFKKPSNI